ncbi:MAG: GNAT family N-acetyltransferase [Lentisphaerae bacterium]|nr:GNAT family N-acetyltransferase [Lentisphaerota bacterium]
MSSTAVRMLLPALRPMAGRRLPAGYTLAAYRTGDAAHWVEICAAAEDYLDINHELFLKQFAGDEAALRARMLFLVAPDRSYVGTATAWTDDRTVGAALGRVHWVAIVPASQGRGLARPLLAAVLERLRQLGHTRAYLNTSTLRVTAINLYLRFGFVPDIRSDQERRAWRAVIDAVKPEWHARLRQAVQA